MTSGQNAREALRLSTSTVIQSLEQLIEMHRHLIDISKKKTDVLIKGSTEELQKLIIQEHKQIQLLENEEIKRVQAVEKWFRTNNLLDIEMTITNMLDHLEDEKEKIELENQTVALTTSMATLKQQEQLNQSLLQQSMQFVQMNLDLLSPSIKNMNYGNKQQATTTDRTVFDSKA